MRKCFLCQSSSHEGWVEETYGIDVCKDHKFRWIRAVDVAIHEVAEKMKIEYGEA